MQEGTKWKGANRALHASSAQSVHKRLSPQLFCDNVVPRDGWWSC